MPTALIKFVQGASMPPAGEALIGVLTTTVTASNGDNTGVSTWQWTVIDRPPGSAVPLGVVSTSSTYAFSPDVRGGYHLELLVTGGSVDRRVFQVLEPSGHLIPPFDALAPALNFSAQARGWAKYLEELLRYLLTLTGPAAPDKSLQYRVSPTAFGGEAYWTREATGRLHADYHVMTGGPGLNFLVGANTIERLFGSWITDGFLVGDVISIHGCLVGANNITTTILARTATIITVSGTLATEAVTAGTGFIEGGALLTHGKVAETSPDTGLWRVPAPPGSTPVPDTVLIAFRRGDTFDSVPALAVAQFGDLGIGGTHSEQDLAAGISTRRPRKISLWTAELNDYSDERRWRRSSGIGQGIYLIEFNSFVTTSGATPANLISKTATVGLFIELYVKAQSTTGGHKAVWRFFGAKVGASVDHQTESYFRSTAGAAAAWTCVNSGDAVLDVTGSAGLDVNWTVYGRFI